MDVIAVNQMREQTIYAVRSNMYRDDACSMFVPGDLRLLIGAIDERDRRIAELEDAISFIGEINPERMRYDCVRLEVSRDQWNAMRRALKMAEMVHRK